MDRHKLPNYELTPNIHTVEIRSNQRPFLGEVDEKAVKVYRRPNRKTGKDVSLIIINPNSYYSYYDDEVLKYSLFERIMMKLTKDLKIRKYEYSRIDIKLDCYEDDSYIKYYKLNTLFIDLLTMAYNFKNNEATESRGRRTRFPRGCYVKNQQWCVDYYDKGKESDYKFLCKSRLEFRMMKIAGKSPVDVVRLLFSRLNKLDTYYEKYLVKCNKDLYTHYKWALNKLPLQGRKDILTSYVRENEDAFYSINQLEHFCKMCGVSNYKARAKSIARTCGIEFVSRKEIREYIAKIKKLITQYMKS